MKNIIIDSFGKKHEITIPSIKDATEKGDVYIVCPICTPNRKPEHKKELKLAINVRKSYFPWRCNHCGESGAVINDEKLDKANLIKPIEKSFNISKVDENTMKWFTENRKIKRETVEYFKIMTIIRGIRQNHVPEKELEFKGQIRKMLCLFFPYYDGDNLIDVQYRDKNKNFSAETGATKIFWNINDMKGAEKGIITEGQLDTMSFYSADCDLPCCSVPNGAIMSAAEIEMFKKTGHIDTKKQLDLPYLDKHYWVFEQMKEVIIATDDDGPGIKLREELARRIGKSKCKYIKWSDWKKPSGDPCKDANDVLIHFGEEELKNSIFKAKNFPILGIIRIKDLQDELMYELSNGKEKGLSIGLTTVNPHFSIMPGHTVVINGYRNMGKTALALQIVTSMAVEHNWKSAIYTPENMPAKRVADKLVQMLIGKPTDRIYENHASEAEIKAAIEYINEYIFIIDEENRERHTHKSLRAKTEELIVRYGIKMVLKDPWNYIREERHRGEQLYDYLLRELSDETYFTKYGNITTLINAHPKTPDIPKSMEIRRPMDYELYGGGVWGAKVDEAITLHRESTSADNNISHLYVDKTKDHDIIGMPCPNDPIVLSFHRKSQRFYDGVDPDYKYHVLDKWKTGTQTELIF